MPQCSWITLQDITCLIAWSNQITFIVTSPQHMCLGEYNYWEHAQDSAETIFIWTVHTYRLIQMTMWKIHIHILSTHSVLLYIFTILCLNGCKIYKSPFQIWKFCGVTTEHWSTAAGLCIVQSLVISSDPEWWCQLRGVWVVYSWLCVCEEGRPCTSAVFLWQSYNCLEPSSDWQQQTNTDHFLKTFSVSCSWSAVSPRLNFIMSLWCTQQRCAAGLCYLLLTLCSWISAFNLDTTTILIKEGEKGSLFGFSLALHQQLTPEPHSWWVYQLDYCFGSCQVQKSSLPRMIVTWNMILYSSTVQCCQYLTLRIIFFSWRFRVLWWFSLLMCVFVRNSTRYLASWTSLWSETGLFMLRMMFSQWHSRYCRAQRLLKLDACVLSDIQIECEMSYSQEHHAVLSSLLASITVIIAHIRVIL